MQEMKYVRPEIEVRGKQKEDIPIGYQKIKYHIIFNINWVKNSAEKHD